MLSFPSQDTLNIKNAKQGLKTLFLDRDGVININHGYVYQTEDCEFVAGIFSLCQAAQKKGYQIIIVTNQSGIARKYYGTKQYKKFSKWIEQQFWRKGIHITKTFHCPHHPKFNRFCTCRKPKIGMITKAQRLFNVDLARSILVGDSLSDMQCAQHAKIKKSILFQNNSLHSSTNTKFMRTSLTKRYTHRYYQAQTLNAVRTLL